VNLINYLDSFIAIAITGIITCYLTLNSVIDVSKKKKLFDEPNETRKIHKSKTPNLGGIGIFFSFIFSITIVLPKFITGYLPYLIASSLIIFAIGVKDDLVTLNPTKKFSAQLLSGLILTLIGDIRITNTYGLFGYFELSYPVSIILTILFYVYLFNSFNLIDGIDTLAGGIGLIGCLTFCFLFYKIGYVGESIMAFGLAVILSIFLYFNYSPAKIFMGDTGSIFLGFMICFFSIRFIEIKPIFLHSKSIFYSKPAIVLSIIIIPFYDTSRVFFLRIINGKSPFIADNNHIHHKFINLGYTHLQTSFILISFNLILIISTILLDKIGTNQIILFDLLLTTIGYIFVWFLPKKTKTPF
jgi:UDP-GlcNAc:undecaprenyl-phosphate GlcNAc-1-phosphate transferase